MSWRPLSSATATAKRSRWLLPLALLAACSGVIDPEEAPIAASPSVEPTRTRTSFSDALTCMDGLLTDVRVRQPTLMTTAEIRDPTKKLGVGGREMIDAALLSMSETNNILNVLRYDFLFTTGDGGSAFLPPGATPPDQERPDFGVTGAISQLDSSALSGQVQGGLSVGESFAVGAGVTEEASVLGIDLQLVNMWTGRIIDHAQNSIVLVTSDRGADVDGTIGKFGGFFEFAFANETGGGQAMRTLVDLSMIELIGELFQVPYWTCLSLDTTAPEIRNRIRSWWVQMSPTERRDYITNALVKTGYLAPDGDLGEAIARFQAENDLPATGRPTFEVYAALIELAAIGGAFSIAEFDEEPTGIPAPAAEDFSVLVNGEELPATATEANPNRIPVRYTVSISQSAYLNCWLQMQDGRVTQLYPNPYQPAAYLLSRKAIHIPDDTAGQFMTVVYDVESDGPLIVGCAASTIDPSTRLPSEIANAEAFHVLRDTTLDDVMAAYRTAADSGFFAADIQKFE